MCFSVTYALNDGSIHTSSVVADTIVQAAAIFSNYCLSMSLDEVDVLGVVPSFGAVDYPWLCDETDY